MNMGYIKIVVFVDGVKCRVFENFSYYESSFFHELEEFALDLLLCGHTVNFVVKFDKEEAYE